MTKKLIDEPRCDHPEMSHRVSNESQIDHYDKDKPLRMCRTCHRPECILDAMAWVSRGTGERAMWAPPKGEYRDSMPPVVGSTPEGQKDA